MYSISLLPGLGTTFFSVPFFSVLFSSFWRLMRPKRTFRSFLKNGKERKECNVILQRTEKNAKNATFFCKNGKERNILLQRTEKNERTFCSFAKNVKERNVAFFCALFHLFFHLFIGETESQQRWELVNFTPLLGFGVPLCEITYNCKEEKPFCLHSN